jgi:hypothetical protein
MTGLEVGRFGSLEIGWVLARGRVFFRSWLLGRVVCLCVRVCFVASSYSVFFFLMK